MLIVIDVRIELEICINYTSFRKTATRFVIKNYLFEFTVKPCATPHARQLNRLSKRATLLVRNLGHCKRE